MQVNIFVELYFYAQRGLALFNEFRYLIMSILGLYYVLKLKRKIWFVVMSVVGLVFIIVAGYVQVNFMSKQLNYLEVENASYWSRYGFELQERQTKAVESIDRKTK